MCVHHAPCTLHSGVAEQLDGTVARDVKILREHVIGGGTFETCSLMWTKDAPTGRKPYLVRHESPLPDRLYRVQFDGRRFQSGSGAMRGDV